VSAAFSTDQAKTLGIFAIAVIIVAGVLLSFVFTKVASRLVLAAIIVGLGILTWTQRDAIDGNAKKCDATFFGIHLTPSNADLKRHCEQLTR
jgi:hypothetical protein